MSDAMIQMAPGCHPDDERILRLRQEWGELRGGPDYDSWIEGKLLQAEDEIELLKRTVSELQTKRIDAAVDGSNWKSRAYRAEYVSETRIAGLEKERERSAVRIDELEASVMSLRAIIDAKLHRRKCYSCGHVGYYAAGVVPYCLCEKCKSQDTNRVK